MKLRILSFACTAALGACAVSSCTDSGLSSKDALRFARGSLEIYRDYKEIRATK